MASLTRFTVLFSHGNAVDMGQMSSFYIGLGTRINCNIFSYDYSGYGVSTGKPSEKNLYADIEAAWQALRTRYIRHRHNAVSVGDVTLQREEEGWCGWSNFTPGRAHAANGLSH